MAESDLLTEISITAPPGRVWHLLTDFASYPMWNPFIRRASGELKEGAQLEVYLKPSGAKGMTFRPRVLKAEPNRELRRLGHFLIPGLFDGEHIFTIEPLKPDACDSHGARYSEAFSLPCLRAG